MHVSPLEILNLRFQIPIFSRLRRAGNQIICFKFTVQWAPALGPLFQNPDQQFHNDAYHDIVASWNNRCVSDKSTVSLFSAKFEHPALFIVSSSLVHHCNFKPRKLICRVVTGNMGCIISDTRCSWLLSKPILSPPHYTIHSVYRTRSHRQFRTSSLISWLISFIRQNRSNLRNNRFWTANQHV